MRVAAALLAVLGATTALQGQEEGQVPKEMLKELQYLVGTWKVEGIVGDEKVEGTWSVRWGPGKYCLMRQSSVSFGDETVTGIGIIGWDGATKTITEQVFSSKNDSALLRWKVLPSGNWEGELSGFRDGKKVNSTLKFTKKGRGEIVYEEKTADGEGVEGILRKVPRKEEDITRMESATIGTASMKKDGTIILDLRAEDEASGAIGDARLVYPVDHPNYESIRKHLPGLKPGKDVSVPPFPDTK